MDSEIDIKTERLVKMLLDSGFDAVILNGQHNFAWLTGGGSNGVDHSRENGAASLVVTRAGRRYLAANNIEMQRLIAEEAGSSGLEQIEFAWQQEKANGGLILENAKQATGFSRFATDIPMFVDAPAIESTIARCRYRLTTAEVERYRRLGSDAAAAIDRVVTRLSPGQSEIEIANEMRQELSASGISSVVTLVGADDRIGRFRHPVPTANTFERTVLLVTCAKRHGLIASLSRMVSLGEPSDELKYRTEATAGVNAALMDATRPGTSGAGLYKVAADAYAAAGFGGEIDLHHQGGAAGYKTRDWVAHPACVETVEADQAFAWNPSITGTKVEETVIVTETGAETLTRSANCPQISVMFNGREYISPGIIRI